MFPEDRAAPSLPHQTRALNTPVKPIRHLFLIRRLSIRAQLLGLLVAALLPAAGGIAWLISHQREQAREAAYARVHVVAEDVAAQIDTLLGDSATMLELLAARPSVRALDPARCDPIFQEHLLLRRESTVLGLRDAKGRLICTSASRAAMPRAADAIELAWFREGLANNRFTVSDAYLGRASGRWVTNLTYPVRNDAGQVTGLLFIGIDLLKLQEGVARNAPRGAFLTVFDRRYSYLMRSVEPEQWIGKPLPPTLLAFIRNRDQAYFQAPNLLGVPQLWSLLRMPAVGWSVAVGLPEEEVLAASRGDLRSSIAVGIGVVLLMLALTWMISSPIRQLARSASRLASSDASARVWLEGPAEIEAVAAHFNRLLDERERTLQNLRRSEERFALATRGSSDGFWDWNILTGEDFFSDRFCELLGYRRDELRPHVDSWRELLHPEDVQPVLGAVRDHLERRAPYDAEIRMRAKSGEYRWFRARGQALWDDSGAPVRMAGSIVDITERRQAEERLRASARGMRDAQQLAKVGSWELDLASNALHWSEEIFRIFEINPEHFGASYEAFLAAIHPEDRDAVNQAYTGSLADRKPYQITHRLRMPDGRIKWIEERCESEFDAAGKPLRSVGTVQDITAQWLAEERVRASLREKEVLLKEIYHRVKNNLQVVSSLLSMQGRGVADAAMKQMLADSSNRVKSMALVHEQLYQSRDLSNIRFRDYVRQLVDHLMYAHRPRSQEVPVRVEAAEIELGLETAIPCGLILNELISNAYKHGHDEGAKGEIVLRAERLDDGRVSLRVNDGGRGLPEGFDSQRSDTLGMRLVVTLVGQLDGELRYGSERGAWFEIVFRPEAHEAGRLAA